MEHRTSHEHPRNPRPEPDMKALHRRELPTTMAAFIHQRSYGEEAHIDDQADGFFRAATRPMPITLTEEEMQMKLIILVDQIKHAKGEKHQDLIEETNRILDKLPPLPPTAIRQHNHLTRSGKVLTLSDVAPEVGPDIDLLELVRVKRVPTRWRCTKTGRQYHLHQSTARRSPRRGKR
jgi:hypothetical protein